MDGNIRLVSPTVIVRIAHAPNDMPMCISGTYGRLKSTYAYSADGRKLAVAYYSGATVSSAVPSETRYYIGPIEFVKSSGANSKLTLQRVNLPWGSFRSDGWDNVNLTDYQGNIRAIASGAFIVDHIDYYPYGLPKASAPGSVSRYKYSGKEFETRGGIDLYDFEARLQLPAAGLFSRPDPKSWDYPDTNPYLYCAANPVMFTDPTGEELHYSDDEDEYTFKIENGRIVVYNGNNNVMDYSQLSDMLYEIVEDLNVIVQTKIGSETVTELVDAETVTTIVLGKENSYMPDLNLVVYNPRGESKSLKCSLNLTTQKLEDISGKNFIGLAHELFHAQDNINGTLDDSIWYKADNGEVVRRGEINACTKENILRGELNLPIRPTYSFKYVYNNYYPDWKGMITSPIKEP